MIAKKGNGPNVTRLILGLGAERLVEHQVPAFMEAETCRASGKELHSVCQRDATRTCGRAGSHLSRSRG